ncbi:hypothetical protein CNR22_23720 [Sphingobacteriaceae bacterium]|nr:hypothetical protein CNR22_23720 [Sphingobacteriaceae bacterium]
MKDNAGKRKILTDRTFPSSEQIAKHQNFERLHKDYSVIKKLLMKKIMLWTAAVLAVAGVTGLVLTNANKKHPALSKTESQPTDEVKSFIEPPFPGMETPFTTYRISAKEGGVINHSTGSAITIPANAFLNEGKPVTDSVDIRYREFHDPLAIFLSGIPMGYDSAGIHNTLESAGMLEILAFENGKSLQLNEQSPIKIKMASLTADERFNLYELDTIQKNWLYKGKDKVEKIKQGQTLPNATGTKRQQTTTRQFAGNAEPAPALADPEKFSFKIAYDNSEFPELSAYEHVLFEVTDKSFKPSYYKINWNKISLYSSDNDGEYLVKLKKADTTISVTAKPVFDKKDYAAALAKFEEKNNKANEQRDQAEFEKQQALNKVNKNLSTYNSKQLLSASEKIVTAVALRDFSIARLGIHNCDFPLAPLVQYAFSFKRDQRTAEEAEKRFSYNTIFLVEKGKNTVFRFAKGQPVRLNPSAKNLMWTMTDKNQVAFFRIEDYTRLQNGNENTIEPVVAESQALAFEEIKKFSE